MMKTKQTAAEAYGEAVSRVNALMTDLQTHLTNHAAKQAADPKNWGYTGDMNHYAELLEELLGRERKAYSVPDGKGGRVRVTIPESE